MTRELVYTAVGWARRRLSLHADERIRRRVIVTRTEIWRSGLATLFDEVSRTDKTMPFRWMATRSVLSGLQ